MDIVKRELVGLLDLVYQYGTIPMHKRLNDNWVINYNMLIVEYNAMNEGVRKLQKTIAYPLTFLADFKMVQNNYGLKDELVLQKIAIIEKMIEESGMTDIPKLVGLKRELEKLNSEVFVPVLDDKKNELMWEINPKDGEQETFDAIITLHENHKDFYDISYAKGKPDFKEEWSDEIKDYYNSIQTVSVKISEFTSEIVNIDFKQLPYTELPTNFPPIYNSIVYHEKIKAIFFLPEKVQMNMTKGMRVVAKK